MLVWYNPHCVKIVINNKHLAALYLINICNE